MDVVEEVIKNKKYKKRVDRLSTEILEIIAKDHIRALEEAYKGVKQEEPERSNDVEYVQALADAMQSLAKKILEKRSKKKPSKR